MEADISDTSRQWVSADALVGSVEAAKRAGFDIAPYLERHGIDAALIDSAQGLISFAAMSECLEDVAKSEQCRDFGYRLALAQRPLQFGVLSQVLQLAPTVGDSIRIFLNYRELYSQSSHWELHEADGIAYLRRYDLNAGATRWAQVVVYSVTRGFDAVKSLAGADWAPLGIYFSFDTLAISASMRRHFGAPIFLGSQFDEIAFQASDLARPLPTGNPELLTALTGYFDRLLPGSTGRGVVSMQVRKILRTRLGDESGALGSVAQSLGVHPRKLQRMLAAERTSFRELQLNSRLEIAAQMIDTTRMQMTEVAMLSGYQHLSSFSRAFRKSRRVPPTRSRAQERN